MGVGKVEAEYEKLKKEVEVMEDRLTEQVERSERELKGLREESDLRIGEWRSRLRSARARNVELKEKAAVLVRDLTVAEEAKYEQNRKQADLLDSMNKAAVFVLTSLEEKYGPAPEDDSIKIRRSALQEIFKILGKIDVEKRKRIVLGSQMVDVEVQTEPFPRKIPVVAPPPSLKRSPNPRRRNGSQTFTDGLVSPSLYSSVTNAPRVRPKRGRIFVKFG
jgi:hypothetical protein